MVGGGSPYEPGRVNQEDTPAVPRGQNTQNKPRAGGRQYWISIVGGRQYWISIVGGRQYCEGG